MKKYYPNYFLNTLFIFGLLLSLFLLTCSKDNQARFTPLKEQINKKDFITHLENQIPLLIERAMIPGLSVAVIREGEIFWKKSFGVKSTESKKPVDDETVYEACSLSKPVFAYAALRLVERGELDLDEPLIEYVTDEYIEKNFLGRKIDDPRFRKITARMVLSHRPGFPNWRSRDSLTINFEPGEKFSYSGEGFGYLQKVIEKITDLSLDEFMHKEVFVPLGMVNSSYIWQDKFDENTSFPHDIMMQVRQKRKSNRGHGAASLHTTASDFAKYVMAVMNHTGLQKATTDSMLTLQVIVEPEESQEILWGLGVGLQKTPHGISYWHWGDNMNFRCFFVAFPLQKMGVVYFTNSFNGLKVRKQIVSMTIGGEHPVLSSNMLNDYGDVDSHEMEFIHVLGKDGVNSAINKYNLLREKYKANEIMSEGALNGIGYIFMRREEYKTAIKIFKLNVEAYPEASNVYDSLGEAYMENGDIELAIQNYEKSVQLNQENTNGIEKLKELKSR